MRIDAKDVPGRCVDEGWVTCRTHVQVHKTCVLECSEFCRYLQQVNHAGHLGVDEDSMSLGLETAQQDVQRVQFAAFHDQTLLIWEKTQEKYKDRSIYALIIRLLNYLVI